MPIDLLVTRVMTTIKAFKSPPRKWKAHVLRHRSCIETTLVVEAVCNNFRARNEKDWSRKTSHISGESVLAGRGNGGFILDSPLVVGVYNCGGLEQDGKSMLLLLLCMMICLASRRSQELLICTCSR